MKLVIETDPETGPALAEVTPFFEKLAKDFPDSCRVRDIPDALYARYKAMQAEKESVYRALQEIFNSNP